MGVGEWAWATVRSGMTLGEGQRVRRFSVPPRGKVRQRGEIAPSAAPEIWLRSPERRAQDQVRPGARAAHAGIRRPAPDRGGRLLDAGQGGLGGGDALHGPRGGARRGSVPQAALSTGTFERRGGFVDMEFLIECTRCRSPSARTCPRPRSRTPRRTWATCARASVRHVASRCAASSRGSAPGSRRPETSDHQMVR